MLSDEFFFSKYVVSLLKQSMPLILTRSIVMFFTPKSLDFPYCGYQLNAFPLHLTYYHKTTKDVTI